MITMAFNKRWYSSNSETAHSIHGAYMRKEIEIDSCNYFDAFYGLRPWLYSFVHQLCNNRGLNEGKCLETCAQKKCASDENEMAYFNVPIDNLFKMCIMNQKLVALFMYIVGTIGMRCWGCAQNEPCIVHTGQAGGTCPLFIRRVYTGECNL